MIDADQGHSGFHCGESTVATISKHLSDFAGARVSVG